MRGSETGRTQKTALFRGEITIALFQDDFYLVTNILNIKDDELDGRYDTPPHSHTSAHKRTHACNPSHYAGSGCVLPSHRRSASIIYPLICLHLCSAFLAGYSHSRRRAYFCLFLLFLRVNILINGIFPHCQARVLRIIANIDILHACLGVC